VPQAHGTAGKGKSSKGKRNPQKEKRNRSDDIPPEPSQEVKESADCLAELKEHLLCQTHSDAVKRTYCWVERGTEKVKGVLSPAPAPVERTTGGMGKSWEPAPKGDFRFCQYVSPRVAHQSGRCDCMSSPSPFSPVR
jgi:hypothetical protein